jgi:hypothetical protein
MLEIMKEEYNIALRDSVTSNKEDIRMEIKMSFKRSELESQKLNRELLDRFD